MINETVFVPKILLCGNASEFFARVGQRPYELVGQIRFVGEINGQAFHFLRNGVFVLGEKIFGYAELPKMLRGGGGDFLVFNESIELRTLHTALMQIGCPRSQVMTLREFNSLPLDGFHDMYSDIQLLAALKNLPIKTLLDADAHFVKSRLFTKAPNDSLEIDCICREEFLPLKENLFRHVYKDSSECALKHYDAALIAERTPADFQNVYSALEHSADLVITFVRNGSALVNYLRDTAGNFERIDVLPSLAGAWHFCRRRTPPEDFAMYVVTHKPLPPEHVQGLPAGCRVIHAGRVLGNDLGYAGDDTGENISALNPYINELTAVYWMWKNTSHNVIGHCSYRRFFTASEEKPLTEIDDHNFSYDKILTKEEALNFLADCDIVVTRLACQDYPQLEEIKHGIGADLSKFAATTMRKHLVRLYPDYADAFDYVINSPSYYQCHMFITRRNIFDTYCKWLFSFILDALNEAFQKMPLANFPPYLKRTMGFFSERMFAVWLMKNRLRVKELNKMFMD